MVFAISSPTPSFFHSSSSSSSSSSSTWKTSSLHLFSISATTIPKNTVLYRVKGIPQLGFGLFSHWNGLKHWGLSISHYSVKIERKGKCKGKGVYASLFGVGAPEALVIGVVALLVFGPKGLAEVARNLGRTLREFQPTIRELQEVSREFKSTLEREIGLDDVDTVPKNSSSSTPKPTPEDTLEDPKTDVEPDASASESGETNDANSKLTGAQFRGALARLQQEQEEERAREEKEKEEKLKLETQSEFESSPPTQDMTEVSADTVQEASSMAVSSQNPESSNAFQEAASVGTSASETS